MNVMRHKVGAVLFILLILLSGISPTVHAMMAPVTYSVRGKVIDRQSRQPVAYANVFVAGIPGKGASTDSLGTFKIEQVPPGIYSLEASCIGYQTVSTPEYIVSASTPFIEIEMEEDANLLNTVVVMPSPFRRSIESPVSMRIIGLQEIEKSPGANRDVSRIVRSYPGVSFSPIGYRNDLIVRGGSPSENRFYMDGIEIPNINHFATQGASGGPVSIVNADLIREITFYTGAFPANRSGALSSTSASRTAIRTSRRSKPPSVHRKSRSAEQDTWDNAPLICSLHASPTCNFCSRLWDCPSCPISLTDNSKQKPVSTSTAS